jgi:hypothetical protein
MVEKGAFDLGFPLVGMQENLKRTTVDANGNCLLEA